MNAIRNGLPSTQTTPYNRLVALTIGITHAPTMLLATLLTLFGFATVVFIPFVLVLYLPDLLLYLETWSIYRERRSRYAAKRTWKRTMLYNVILIIATTGFFTFVAWDNGVMDSLALFSFVPGHISRALLAATAYRDLLEAERREGEMPSRSESRVSEPEQQTEATEGFSRQSELVPALV